MRHPNTAFWHKISQKCSLDIKKICIFDIQTKKNFMKSLNKLSQSHLRVLEIGQLNKSTLANMTLLPAGTITDPVLLAYVTQLNDRSNDYDAAMLHIAKSDQTAKITNADMIRDKAISAYKRMLSVHELSEVEAELDAYASLNNLMTPYNGIERMNLEQESNAIDNLLVDLATPHYAPHITTLNMASFVTRINSKNTDFKNLFNTRTQETAGKPTFDVKQLRTDLLEVYNQMATYVLAMSNALNTNEYNATLDILNAIRKYYHDMLARRKGNDDSPIPPMLMA
jgi:hypothetical protein